jgi:phosphatidylserine/phosphatidylglycerophosphate/cardiolipin synthase-like enzyme
LPLALPSLLAFEVYINTADANSKAQVYFSPNGGCTKAIIKEIEDAESEILIQAYSFTSKPIAQALVKAHKKGIHVEIILDKSNTSSEFSALDFTAHAGIPAYIDAEHASAHNQIIIIDRETVITGSFNFTKAAEEKNAENLLIIKSRELAKLYLNNWQEHRKHSTLYQEK